MVIRRRTDRLEKSFKVFHELMARRVQEILLISSPYDAFIMEEDGRLAGRIIHEYRGLNLTRPPRITWVSSGREALQRLGEKKFDLVITMTRLDDMEPAQMCGEIKMAHPDLPIYYLSHEAYGLKTEAAAFTCDAIDRRFVWLGNTDLLLALIKHAEDRLNVDTDTEKAGVRVILVVEDSPLYISSVLPFLYKEIVRQTQSAMDESLNEEHRILRMRARPKILLAESYEAAQALYHRFDPYILTVLCDARFPRQGRLANDAGIDLLSEIKRNAPVMPVLMFSSEPENRPRAEQIQANFADKNSSSLHQDIRTFLIRNLGFDDFIFRLPDGREVGRAATLYHMAEILGHIPDASIEYHALREDFSIWMMARMEIELAEDLRAAKVADFNNICEVRDYILNAIFHQRCTRQRGVVVEFGREEYDPTAEFVKMGSGSMGGKARGLAFMAARLKNGSHLKDKFPQMAIEIPRTLVVTTEWFEAFLNLNNLRFSATCDLVDSQIEAAFLNGRFPEEMVRKLSSFIQKVRVPLAVRSSSLLEDAQAQPSAGVFKTLMIPNNHPDPGVRLNELLRAIQRVYASTYFNEPRSFAQRSPYRIEEDRMAVMIQTIVGQVSHDYFYPAISGVAQSYNFYPVSHMKPADGIAHIALGLGRSVVEGGAALRFCPRYPQLLPQIDTVAKALKNAQRSFFALKMPTAPEAGDGDPDLLLEQLMVDQAALHPAVQLTASTYIPADQRIRDTAALPGEKLITFAGILKYELFPLAEVVAEILELGRHGMGCPVEMEFAVNLPEGQGAAPYTFSLLQIRPMAKREQSTHIEIFPEEEKKAFCRSSQALGNGIIHGIADIVLVRPDKFDPARTVEIAGQISDLNREIAQQGRRYVLIGPGRWGSADRWLGIPVSWPDITAVAAIVETTVGNLNADPSQGSHFFHNITSLGIGYLTVTPATGAMDTSWLMSLAPRNETAFVRHVVLEKEMLIKIDGKSSRAVMIYE